MRWQNCVLPPQGNHADAYTDTDFPGLNCSMGQATGTFQAKLTGHTFANVGVVPGGCQLSAADEKTLLALPTAPPPPGGQYRARRTGRAGCDQPADPYRDPDLAQRGIPADQGPGQSR